MKTVISVAQPSVETGSLLTEPPSSTSGSKLVPLTLKILMGSLALRVCMALPANQDYKLVWAIKLGIPA